MKKICITILILCCLIGMHGFDSSAEKMIRLSNEEKPKVISLVYDNSSSMFHEGDNYNTRWVESDYAVKALTAMMDEGDILNLYVMGNYKEWSADAPKKINKLTVTIQNDRRKALQEVEGRGGMKEMKFTEWTYYQGVEAAVEDMKSYSDDYDCWIVILTDGVFYRPKEFENLKNDSKKIDLLKRKLEEVISSNAFISVAYIPIGEEKERKITSDEEGRIFVPKAGISITDKIIEVVNQIYGRVQLESDLMLEEGSNSGEHPIQYSESGTKVKIDIPLERMIIFLQEEGEEKKRIEFGEKDLQTLKEKIVNKDPEIEGDLQLLKNCFFHGREDLPEMEDDVGTYKEEEIKYRVLEGEIYNLEAGAGANEKVIQQEEVTFDKKIENISVYYQPAVKVKVQYRQNGEEIPHEISSGDQKEYLEEGDLELEICLVDRSGNELQNKNSPLLYQEKFRMTLYDQQDNEVFNEEGCNYQCTLEKGNYTLTVHTPWKEVYTEQIEVNEKKKALSIENLSGDDIRVDLPDEESSVLKLQLKEDGEKLTAESLAAVKGVTCSCEDENFVIEQDQEYENGKDGIWSFRIKLKDMETLQIPEYLDCKVEAVRTYSDGEEVSFSETIRLKMKANPYDMVIELGSHQADKYYRRLFGKEVIPVNFICDGNNLEGEEREGLKISNLVIEPQSMKDMFLIDDNFNIRPKAGIIKWWYPKAGSVKFSFDVAFSKWNNEGTDSFTGEISMKYIPVEVRRIVNVFLAALAVWILLCLLKMKSSRYIRKFKAALAADEVRRDLTVKLYRGRHLCLPFWKTAYLKYKEPKVQTPYVRSFTLKIMKNQTGTGWILKNYSEFANANLYTIGNLPITENNNVFSQDIRFAVRDKENHWRDMKISK